MTRPTLLLIGSQANRDRGGRVLLRQNSWAVPLDATVPEVLAWLRREVERQLTFAQKVGIRLLVSHMLSYLHVVSS